MSHHRDADALRNDCPYFAHGGRDAMTGRSISGRETFARNDEGGRVRASIEEKLAHNVERKQPPL